jgi:hypothetical protein
VLTGFQWGNLREKEHVQDLGVDGRLILKLIFKSGIGDVDRIDLAEGCDMWRSFFSAVMNSSVS